MMAAVISQVGVYDMLRYQLFTIGEHPSAMNHATWHLAQQVHDTCHKDQLKLCCLTAVTA